jgi:hypothetical protein
MIAKILQTTAEGQILAGTFSLDGKKLKIEANNGYEHMMKSISEYVCIDDEEEVTSEENPKRWIELLPKNFSGSYVRAEVVEE